MTMEIVKNNKGGSKLCFEGYTCTKKSASKTTYTLGMLSEEGICLQGQSDSRFSGREGYTDC